MVIPPWKETAQKLLLWGGFEEAPPDDKWVRDALRGTMWLRKWRGTLDEFLANGISSRAEIAKDTYVRISSLAEAPPVDWDQVEKRRLTLHGLGLGTYGWKYDQEILLRAAGRICLLDTSEGYGFGRTETAIGEYLRSYSLRALLATKFQRTRTRKETILAAFLRSKQKLGARIDLYQLHWPLYPYLNNAAVALRELKEAKQISFIGLCNVSTDLIETFQRLLGTEHRVDTVQIRFNADDDSAAEVLIPYCRQRGINVIAYSPLGQVFKRLQQKTGVANVAGALSYVMDGGAIPIPRTNNLDHLEEILSCTTSLSSVEVIGERE